eukprot:Gb_40610 [translate_table: standard]
MGSRPQMTRDPNSSTVPILGAQVWVLAVPKYRPHEKKVRIPSFGSMLAFPLFMDQFPACKLVVNEWKIRLRLKSGMLEKKTAERGLIARNVKRSMNREEGNQMRRAENLGNIAKKAGVEGGSSFTDLDKFLQVFSRFKSMSVE